MRLPQLKVIQDEVREPVSCTQHDYCSSCKLFHRNGGRCDGCTPQHRAELGQEFQWCHQECHSCTGYKTNVTAVCCRSPLKNMYLDAVTRNPDNWNELNYKYHDVDPIKYDRKAIFYFNYGSAMRITDGGKKGHLVDHEVIAVSMKEVKAQGKSFITNDLHDYLCLAKKTKIILTTMVIDDHLERAWTECWYERQAEECERVGVKYWMPLAFSTYNKDARMHSYYQFCRTQICTEASRAHFFAGNVPWMKLDDVILKGVEKIPQVMFNTQLLPSDVKDPRFVSFFARMKWWHELVPKKVSFWFVGSVTPTFVHNLRKMCGKRDLYFVSGKPLYLAIHGKRLKPSGSEEKLADEVRADKLELIHDNYAVFERIVNSYGSV